MWKNTKHQFLREIKEDLSKWRDIRVHGPKTQCYYNVNSTQIILQIQHNPNQNPSRIFSSIIQQAYIYIKAKELE